MRTKQPPPPSIDAYIAGFPPEVRARAHEPEDAERDQRDAGADVQRLGVGDDAQHDDQERDERDRALMPDRDRPQRPQHGAPGTLLHPQRDREQPAHRGVEPVIGAQQAQQDVGPERVHYRAGKQYESDDASPPASRIWCGRSPLNGTKNSGSTVSEPSAPASSLTIQPSIPAG